MRARVRVGARVQVKARVTLGSGLEAVLANDALNGLDDRVGHIAR